jgi:low affinity Fe/Cu permease
MKKIALQNWFNHSAKTAAHAAGRPLTFVIAAALILVWAVTGPLFDFSDTWQLMVNTVTTVVTFLMVFLIQNTQTRDTEALQVKLDELIRATKEANKEVLDLEELDADRIEEIRSRYQKLARCARQKVGDKVFEEQIRYCDRDELAPAKKP